jgi:hypothetical protein
VVCIDFRFIIMEIIIIYSPRLLANPGLTSDNREKERVFLYLKNIKFDSIFFFHFHGFCVQSLLLGARNDWSTDRVFSFLRDGPFGKGNWVR